jgi:hypothetical protein
MNEFALVLQGPRAALTEASGHAIDPGDGSMACCSLVNLTAGSHFARARSWRALTVE